MTGTNVVVFIDHRGATIAINADGPVSCLRYNDNRNHLPFDLAEAREGRVPDLIAMCTGQTAYRLSVEPVNCRDCLELADEGDW